MQPDIILFVDDDVEIISSTKRMLYLNHHDWNVLYATSGAAALKQMEEHPVTVIVSDIRMPGMTGIEFLKEVKERWPQTIRIVLSGHSDRDSSLQASGLVHQFLAKPCPIDVVIQTIENALKTEDVIQDPNLKRILGQLKTIPSQPSAYTQIVEELKNPEASTATVGKIIARDVSMSAKILQLVNSAFFSLPQTIIDPTQAVVMLGVETIRDLVLAIGIFSQFDPAKLERFELNNLWHHSQRVSSLAKTIVLDSGGDKKQVNHALIAGLIHDIGRLVLADNLPDQYEQLIDRCSPRKASLYEMEIAELGTSHAHVGAYLLGVWGLPDPVIQGVIGHHDLWISKQKPSLVQVAVHVANVLDYQAHPQADSRIPLPVLNTSEVEANNMRAKLEGWVKTMQEL